MVSFSCFLFSLVAPCLSQIAVTRPERQTKGSSKSSASVSSLCPGNDYSGLHPFPSNCGKFVNCWKGRAFVQDCAPGTEFNAKSLQCDFPAKADCKATQSSPLLPIEEQEEPTQTSTQQPFSLPRWLFAVMSNFCVIICGVVVCLLLVYVVFVFV